MITNCQVDAERLAPLRECMETYGQEGSEEAEWPWNCLSRRTVAYSCGALRRGDEPAIHNHDETEFALCRHLAEEAAGIMQGVEVGMGSEAGDGFAAFFVVASEGADNPQTLTPDTIRNVFGGTIYPEAEITVEPLAEQGAWWDSVTTDCGAEEDEEYEEDGEPAEDGYDEDEELSYEDVLEEDETEEEDEEAEEELADCLRPWRSLIQWFQSRPEFRQTAFVQIGDSPLDEENGASVFPRLAVGLTPKGSIAGIAGYVVHT